MDEGKRLYKIGRDYFLNEDYINARIYYEKAGSEYNHGKSYNQLGYMYEHELGVDQDDKKAFDYYNKFWH